MLNVVKVLIKEKKLGKEIGSQTIAPRELPIPQCSPRIILPQTITPGQFPPWTIAPGLLPSPDYSI